MPRGRERFERYLREMLNDARDDVRYPPLGIMNPMGKDHVRALLDSLLAMDAEGAAALAATEASRSVAQAPGRYRIGLVVADDAMGAWTNRYDCEFSHRFENQGSLRRGWLSGILWTSEAPSLEAVRAAVRAPIHRAAYAAAHGPARTLRERLAQEGSVLARAGGLTPTLDPGDLVRTLEILAPHLEAEDRRTNIECLFGDTAAESLAFTPRGLKPWAGLALALHQVRAAAGTQPETV